MNKIVLVGNLTKAPEMGKTKNEKVYTKITLAVPRAYTDADGNRPVDYFNITLWDKQAEVAQKYLDKGHKFGVSGSMQFREGTDANGDKRYYPEVAVSDIEFLQPKTKSEKEAFDGMKPLDEKDGELPF